MLVIELRFPAGRYHATPWDHHVNEGAVEWPPAPFRLLRALIATWDLKLGHEIDRESVSRVVTALSAETPDYALPRSTAAHLRHYMPLYKDATTKIFDTFIAVESDAPLYVRWSQVTLGSEERSVLGRLLAALGYLGRAESWVLARLMEDGDLERLDRATTFDVQPLPSEADLPAGKALCRLLAPLPPAELPAWVQTMRGRIETRRTVEKREKAAAKGGDTSAVSLSKKELAGITSELPASLWDVLCCDTGELQKKGWSAVPGARWIHYARPEEARRVSAGRGMARAGAHPTVARFAVASQVPPRLTDAVSVADRIHRALTKWSDGASVFAGKVGNTPLTGNEHAFILPEANGKHGFITHVTIVARMGFDPIARHALEGLRKVWGRDRHDLQLVLLGLGQLEDFASPEGSPLLQPASCWESITPFVPTLHPRTTKRGAPKCDANGLQIGSPEYDLRRLLHSAQLDPVRVTALPAAQLGGKPTSWLDFHTVRKHGSGARGPRSGIGFRLEFKETVRGPIAVGFGAHFGLGTFLPAGLGPVPIRAHRG